MLRKIMNRKKAITGVIAGIVLILLCTVWPARLWTSDHVLAGTGEVTSLSETVDQVSDAGAAFKASYSHLQELEIYVGEVESGHSFWLRLFGEVNGYPALIAEQEVPLEASEVPGYVSVPLDVDLVPGNDYTYIINTDDAAFRVGYEEFTVEEQVGNGTVQPIYLGAFHHDTTVEQTAIAARFLYRMPLTKWPTLGLMGLIVVIGAILTALVKLWFRKFPAYNTLVTGEQVMKWVATPVVVGISVAAALMIGPFRMFDQRMTDILFYELGVVIFLVISLYAIFHKRTGNPILSPFARLNGREKVQYVILAVLLAMIIGFCCEYENALYDLTHSISERKMVLVFLLFILATYSLSELAHRYNFLWIVVSGIAGIVYGKQHWLAATEKEYDEHNLALTLAILIVMALGLVIIQTVRLLASGWPKKSNGRNLRLSSYYVAALALLFGLIVAFRNTRWWTVVLVILLTLFYLRFLYWKGREYWLSLLSDGICLQFIGMVLLCLTRRYYMSFLYTRFSMGFHTVTITAVYLTVVMAVLCVKFIGKLMQTRGLKFSERVQRVYPEALLLGIAATYLLMTMSRTGVLGVVATAVVLLIAVVFSTKKISTFFTTALAMVGVTILTFPVIFTAQRIIPPLVDRPYIFELESYPDAVMRNNDLDSMYYICVERFGQVFGNKMFGLPEGDYDFYHTEEEETSADLQANAAMTTSAESQANVASSAENGGVIEELQALQAPLLASAGEVTIHPVNITDVPGLETSSGEDYTNGRLSIYKSYLQQMNLFGHDTMGAVLEDGSIAMHAHDVFLQVAFDHGIVTGVWFFLFTILTFVRACLYYKKNRLREDAMALLPMAAIVSFATAGLVEWVFQLCNPTTILLFMAIAPLLCRDRKKLSKNTTDVSGMKKVG